ncbi:MAG TPA: Rieske (2Fe-2S) protein [Trebonia sp.]|jgi:Rieske Fe-S protein|nr:Rieske (2Fe-2S) protein [Trebonia sp.]
MTQQSQQDRSATRRGVLLGAGLIGAGGALAGCSTAAVPYDADEAGVAPGSQASSPTPAAPAAAAGTPAGTVLGATSQIPVGGGVIFTDAKVAVTQPSKGEFKAFSAVCTHVGCLCDKVAGGTIDCPCHGSKFKIANGDVVTGPATLPLPPRTISVSGGQITLLD